MERCLQVPDSSPGRGTVAWDAFAAVATGVVYVLLVVFWPLVQRSLLGMPSTALAVRESGSLVHAAGLPVYAIPLLGVLLTIRLSRQGDLLRSLRGTKLSSFTIAVLIGAAVSVLLNSLGVWPFPWQRPDSYEATHVALLILGGQRLGLLLMALVTIVVVPLVEEVVFRFGVLELLLGKLHSLHAAVLASAALFAALHLGQGGGFLGSRVGMNAAWLFIGSVILGYVAVMRGGKIGVPIGVHAGHNMVHIALLISATVRELRVHAP